MSSFTRPDYEDVARLPLAQLIPDNVRTLLDVGCNTGGFGSYLKKRQQIEVWGIEPDQTASRIASTKLDCVINDYFLPSNPVPNHYFDVVSFNDSIEHMVDPASALRLAIAKLRDDGFLLCCVPNIRHIENLEHLLFKKDWEYTEFGIRDRTHLRFFTKKSVIRLLNECGIQVEKVVGINEQWWAKDKLMRRIFFWLFPAYTKDMRHIQFAVVGRPVRRLGND